MALTRITKGVIKPNENYQAGIVTATGLDVNGNGDISGDLNVGGILTYEDVTSIDSVGIITAQKGIHVGGGVSAIGVGTFSGLDIGGDIDVDGQTNLDNVSIAGVTTMSGNLSLESTYPRIYLKDTNHNPDFSILNNDGNLGFRDDTNGEYRLQVLGTGETKVYHNLIVDKDIDVDGHTNLDNVSVAGVVTFSNSPSAIDMNDNSRISFGTSLKTSIYYNSSESKTYIRNWNDTLHIGYRNTEIYHTNQPRLTFDSGNTFSNVVNTNFTGANYSAVWVPASNMFRLNDNAKLALGSQGDTTIYHNNANLLISNTTGNIDVTGNVVLNNDISVDGHTNLDNVSVAGVITATSFSGSGASLTNLNGSNIASGTVPVARIGTGTKSTSTFYRGDGTFATVTAPAITAINSPSNNRIVTSDGGTTVTGESSFTYDGNGGLDMEGTGSAFFQIKTANNTDGGVYFRTGSTNAGAVSYLHTTDTTDKMNFRVGSTNKFIIHTSGFAELAGAADVRLTLGNAGTAGTNNANWIRGVNNNLYYNAATSDHLWEIGGTEHMRLRNDGNLYLRSESANYVVMGSSGDATSGGITNNMNWIRGNGTNTQYNTAGGFHAWEVSGSQKLVLSAGGDLGLNVTNPNSRLAIYDADGHNLTLSSHNWSGEARIGFTGGATNVNGTASGSTAGALGVTASAPGGAATGYMSFYTNPGDSLQNRMTIDSSGRLLLGSSFSSNVNTFKYSIKESSNENAAILFLDTDNMRGGICGGAKGTNELITGTSNFDFVVGSLYADTHIIYGQSGNQNGTIGMTVAGTTGHVIINEGLGVGGQDPGGATLRVHGNINLSAGGNTSWQKVNIEGSGNTSGDNLSMNNWGDAEGDYWMTGVNQTMNGSGNYVKTNSGKRTSFITLDGRMGRVYLGGAGTGTNPTEHFYTNWDGTVYMNSGFGSVVPFYGVRAWVQGNSGTTNASGGLSSMQRMSAGAYRLNFASTMPDDNYAVGCLANNNYSDTSWFGDTETGYCRVHFYSGGSYQDPSEWSAWVIR